MRSWVFGGAWFETEHTAFGMDFGASVGERLDWLDEAVAIIHGMLPTPSATAVGPHYQAVGVRNDPPPIQARLPILIGGSGERKTLQTIARYADGWNAANLTPDEAAHKDVVLRRWCDEVGRDRTRSNGPSASGRWPSGPTRRTPRAWWLAIERATRT